MRHESLIFNWFINFQNLILFYKSYLDLFIASAEIYSLFYINA